MLSLEFPSSPCSEEQAGHWGRIFCLRALWHRSALLLSKIRAQQSPVAAQRACIDTPVSSPRTCHAAQSIPHRGQIGLKAITAGGTQRANESCFRHSGPRGSAEYSSALAMAFSLPALSCVRGEMRVIPSCLHSCTLSSRALLTPGKSFYSQMALELLGFVL